MQLQDINNCIWLHCSSWLTANKFSTLEPLLANITRAISSLFNDIHPSPILYWLLLPGCTKKVYLEADVSQTMFYYSGPIHASSVNTIQCFIHLFIPNCNVSWTIYNFQCHCGIGNHIGKSGPCFTALREVKAWLQNGRIYVKKLYTT